MTSPQGRSRRSWPGALVPGLAALVVGLGVAACTGAPDVAELPRPHLQVRRDAVRPTQPEALFPFDEDSAVRSYATDEGRARVHYGTHGRHQTIMDDVDGDQVPDFVQLVARTTEEVLDFWARRGLRPPTAEVEVGVRDDGGDERFDVYLVDFDISADGYFGVDACSGGPGPFRCAGHLVIENDFAEQGYPNLQMAVGILVSHELYHAISAAYDGEIPVWWSEATAVWAEEEFDPSQRDFEAFLPGFFERPDRSLDAPLPGPVDPFSYGLAIFPRFLSERWDASLLREVMEALEDGAGGLADPDPIEALDGVLQQRVPNGLMGAYAEFARWNLFTSTRADASRSYELGRSYPSVALEAWEALPYEDSFRLFHLASVYLSFSHGERTEVTASLEGVDTTDLQLALLEIEADGGPGELVVHQPANGPAPVLRAKPDSRRVMVLASNLSLTGRSVRPVLCAGTPEEVAACALRHGGPGDPDAGPPVADVGPPDRDSGVPAPADAGQTTDGALTDAAGGLLDGGVADDAAQSDPDDIDPAGGETDTGGAPPSGGSGGGSDDGCSLGAAPGARSWPDRPMLESLSAVLLRGRGAVPGPDDRDHR